MPLPIGSGPRGCGHILQGTFSSSLPLSAMPQEKTQLRGQGDLALNPDSATSRLCSFGQVSSLLQSSFAVYIVGPKVPSSQGFLKTKCSPGCGQNPLLLQARLLLSGD